ncbi:zinc-binding dehydrogenase [Arthrobacter sp. FW306-05-C]|uniref:zinc-dependent alcohol dehydrogenase n=1 Tax=Arthrobacter sp. FW306-05-C TaxID=2879620 RepID=UPI001F27E34D|nr:zinc-binding dehydrogenase [Arthrobacter sp. FW306-05-C]UKA66570.1 zinc-binding dehydrogenase [Arthrobacter sp. FW306-05-C]
MIDHGSAVASPDPAPALTAPLPSAVRAAVSLPDSTTRVQTVDPGLATDAAGWLKVESSALCGTDLDLYQQGLGHPTVMGHHVVGEIVSVTPVMQWSWDVAVGDRVALEEYLPCGQATCAACRQPDVYRFCPDADLWGGQRRVGMLGLHEGSGLHGGNAEYMELSTRTVLHKLPRDLDSNLAAWTQPFANAVDWVINIGGATGGSRVAIIGPGYHGIAAVAAARAAGADEIVVLGRNSRTSRDRLEIAEAMGASIVVNDDAAATSLALGRHGKATGFDTIVDTVGLGGPALQTTEHLRKLGRLVLAGLGETPVAEVNLKTLVRGASGVVGVRGRSPQALTRSIELLAAHDTGLEHVPSIDVGLEGVDELFRTLLDRSGPSSPHVVIRPSL